MGSKAYAGEAAAPSPTLPPQTRISLALWLCTVLAVGVLRAIAARLRAALGCALIEAGVRVLGDVDPMAAPAGMERRIMARLECDQAGERGGAT